MARSATRSECTRKATREGRHVWLPGRGRTFVHQLTGPRGAPTLVLLHGLNSTADLSWSPNFDALAKHFNVIALDHRGHGQGIRRDTPFRLVDCADDAAALVRQLGCGPVIPVGYSMGGPIAQLFCHRHPDLVSGVVFCATSCLFRDSFREDVLFSLAAGTAVRHDWSSIVEAGRELDQFDSRPWIREIEVPAAMVITDRDTVVPPERQLLLVDRLRDLTVVHVDGGHNVCGTDPSTFVPALLDACLAVSASVRRAAQRARRRA